MDRNRITKLLGPSPAKCPLEPDVLEDADCGSYRRLKVGYAVERGERVKAYLLLPKTVETPAPAVVAHHQHAGQFHLGKSEVVGLAGDPDQAYGAELAERGYVVIASDALGFEERNWGAAPGQAEYYEMASRLVKGETLLAKVLHDLAAAVDYLASRPEVDASRVGFIGHSYGGRSAIWAAALDGRIKASVSNCGCVNYKNSLVHEAGVQMAFCVPGVLRHGDVEDVARLVAPRALLIQAADGDKWSRGARELFHHANASFPPGQLELKVWRGGHAFTEPMRKNAYAFLDRHLSKLR